MPRAIFQPCLLPCLLPLLSPVPLQQALGSTDSQLGSTDLQHEQAAGQQYDSPLACPKLRVRLLGHTGAWHYPLPCGKRLEFLVGSGSSRRKPVRFQRIQVCPHSLCSCPFVKRKQRKAEKGELSLLLLLPSCAFSDRLTKPLTCPL
jgi:hypothetical protein